MFRNGGNFAPAPERDCAESQSQQPKKRKTQEDSNPAVLGTLLRLTEPRSARVGVGAGCPFRNGRVFANWWYSRRV